MKFVFAFLSMFVLWTPAEACIGCGTTVRIVERHYVAPVVTYYTAPAVAYPSAILSVPVAVPAVRVRVVPRRVRVIHRYSVLGN
jgi:hypothetical protein